MQAFLVEPGNKHGTSVSVHDGADHVFGFVMINNWAGMFPIVIQSIMSASYIFHEPMEAFTFHEFLLCTIYSPLNECSKVRT